MTIKLLRTTPLDPDFLGLVKFLDAYLAVIDGDDHVFYAHINAKQLNHAVLAFEDDIPIGCGAIKVIDADIVEIKRMYTSPEHRGKGVAGRILDVLEQWALELNHKKAILETGLRQQEAIALYKKHGYVLIENYEPYGQIANSVCFGKSLEKS